MFRKIMSWWWRLCWWRRLLCNVNRWGVSRWLLLLCLQEPFGRRGFGWRRPRAREGPRACCWLRLPQELDLFGGLRVGFRKVLVTLHKVSA